MNRRGFLKWVAGATTAIAVGAKSDARLQSEECSIEWILRQIANLKMSTSFEPLGKADWWLKLGRLKMDEGFTAQLIGKRFNYRITVLGPYIGASLQAKEPRLGEDWLRGSDLADGKLSVETWTRIEADIKRCEETGSKYGEQELDQTMSPIGMGTTSGTLFVDDEYLRDHGRRV